MIYFTADTHFSHEKILEYCVRPFETVEEMDDAIIENWNEVVRPEDTVYHLGDFTLMGYQAKSLFQLLSGTKYIVPGGHDWRWLKHRSQSYINLSAYAEANVHILPPLHSLEIKTSGKYPQVVVLCHYPMARWDRSHYGSIHLHGHTHGTLPSGKIWSFSRSGDTRLPPKERNGFRYDVGVDTNNFTPVSLDEILRRMG